MNGIEMVFQNDYIMTKILRMLELNAQFQIQKLCPRLHFLMTTCVWRRDLKEMEMNRNHFSNLTDDEFLELLLLNADNVGKLKLDGENGIQFQRYFPVRYTNLLELHIKNFKLDEQNLHTIVENCPQLHLFDYCESSKSKPKYMMEYKFLLFPSFRKLLQLKTVILKNILNSICFEDLYLLALEVPLEQLRLIKIRTCESECDIGTMFLPNLKVLEIKYRGSNFMKDDNYEKFLKKCLYLQELKLNMTVNEKDINFDIFKKLESAKLECLSRKPMREFGRNKTLKKLLIIFGNSLDRHLDVNEGDICCLNLESLEIIKFKLLDTNICLDFFRPSLRNFEKLKQISLFDGEVTDELLRIISLQCPQLESLTLLTANVSGIYINRFVKLKKLIILFNKMEMSFSNLFYILKDIQYLEYLELDCSTLYNDNFSIPMHTRDLANSLETLKLANALNNIHFFKEVATNCRNSFQAIRTVYLEDVDKYFDMNFIRCFKQLTVLKTEEYFIRDTFCDDIKETSIIHLEFVKGYNLYWSTLVNILKTCNVETIEIFEMSLEDKEQYVEYQPIENDQDVYTHIRKIIIPYDMFQANVRFWIQCQERSAAFQLFCYGHSEHKDVLEPLIRNTYGKKSIKAIHATNGFDNIKLFLLENKIVPKIPVHVLDADSKDFWNPRFVDEKRVIMIEV